MEDSQQKDYSFLGNDTLPSLYDAQAYERKFKSEYSERQFYGRETYREITYKSDLPKLSVH